MKKTSPIHKKILFSVFIFCMAAAICLCGVEMQLRQTPMTWDPQGLESGPRAHQHCYQPSIHTGYEAIPNTCERDAQGFYRTWKGEAPTDALSILVYGDSIADQHQWVQHTTTSISKQRQRTTITRNAGTPGFDTCSELETFLQHGIDVAADVLVLQICPNDLAVSATIIPKPNNTVQLFVGWESVELPRWVLEYRTLTWLTLEVLLRQARENDQTGGMRSSIKPMNYCLQEFETIAKEKNMLFIPVLFPAFIDTFDDKDVVVRTKEYQLTASMAETKTIEILNSLQLPYFSIRDVFTTHNMSLVEYRNAPDDMWHPNNQAQKIIGEDLGQYIVQQLQTSTKVE